MLLKNNLKIPHYSPLDAMLFFACRCKPHFDNLSSTKFKWMTHFLSVIAECNQKPIKTRLTHPIIDNLGFTCSRSNNEKFICKKGFIGTSKLFNPHWRAKVGSDARFDTRASVLATFWGEQVLLVGWEWLRDV